MFNTNLFAKKLSDITPYAVDTQSYRIRLDANESYIQLPDNIRADITKSINTFKFNRYPDPDATLLVKAFCDYYNVDTNCVAAGNGSDEIICLLMSCFLDFGDTVMTFTPDFSMYAFYAKLYGAKVAECPKNTDLQIDFQKAQHTIKQNNVKLCIFSNPCNPTGCIETKADIKMLAEACPDTIFVSDEAYMDFAAEKQSFLCDTQSYSNIIVLKTLSKALGGAALRLGFIVADKSFIKMFKAVKSPYNVNGISQEIGRIILSNKQMLDAFTSQIVSSTQKLSTLISETGVLTPSKTHTNFLFIRNPKSKDLWEYLKSQSILVRYFNTDGGALRITAGSDEENEYTCEKIKNFGGYNQ